MDPRTRGCAICLDGDELVAGEVEGLPACDECVGHQRAIAVLSGERTTPCLSPVQAPRRLATGVAS